MRLGFAALLLAIAASCSSAELRSASDGSQASCVADSIEELRLVSSVPDCGGNRASCEAACTSGDAAACLSQGYASEEKGNTAHAHRAYRRACLLGLANACTNHAAKIWAGDLTDEQLQCARRTFEKACAVEEHFACGMLSRLALAAASSPAEVEKVHEALEASCERVGGFSCRVLAKHLEEGAFGGYEPARIGQLLERACRGGDPDGCHHPETASETFD